MDGIYIGVAILIGGDIPGELLASGSMVAEDGVTFLKSESSSAVFIIE
ncbi:MAG: hypothetical protein [Podoviridae sp. ctrTa16]|nr:MAG: hypothetical protein [Podoviridae sp. ctrTa16]